MSSAFPAYETNDEELRRQVIEATYDKAYEIAKAMTSKHERMDRFDALEAEFEARFSEEELAEKKMLIKRYFHDDVLKKAMRNMILDEGIRLDGRRTDEIRPIWCEIDYLPGAHGSAIFTRGETQSLTTVTLGTKMDEKQIDDVLVQGTEQFVLHGHNFPPFSTGEARPARGLSRREIGHGNLAWRALKPMVPVGRGEPLCRSRGIGHSRVERLVVDGYRLRRHAGADGCRRKAEKRWFRA